MSSGSGQLVAYKFKGLFYQLPYLFEKHKEDNLYEGPEDKPDDPFKYNHGAIIYGYYS